MAKRQVMFTFPQELIREPIIYSLGQQFKIVTNIRRADVTENRGWVILELEGEDRDIEQGIAWVTSKGVRVDPVAGDVAFDGAGNRDIVGLDVCDNLCSVGDHQIPGDVNGALKYPLDANAAVGLDITPKVRIGADGRLDY